MFIKFQNFQKFQSFHTEYYMSKSASHAVSTREPFIIPRATGRRGDIGRVLIRHVIRIFTCNVHYIIYFNHAFDTTCIQIFTIFLPEQSYFPIQIYHFLNFFHMYSNCYICKFWSNSNIYTAIGNFTPLIKGVV